ncbi:hypothetical protein CEP51_004616 [Fusarium floridanum]|uniref:C2H2-type domain-containing protein n=1 Tax=Fusarium floridanum TaxID=1325733 RepID=A0A428S0A7_9HYPO|nr:hypothetical protein CEP51_004616 [Fusarium floridanum]
MKGRPRLRVAPCKYCNKEFKRQEHLDRHIRTHTRERPFGCSCGRTFSRQDLLSRHYRLSQCSDTATSPCANRRGSTATRPPQSTLQTFPVEPTAVSPPIANTNHSRTNSFTFEHHPSMSGDIVSNFAAQTPQEQFMGKFSIHDPVYEPPNDNPDVLSNSGGPSSSGDDHMDVVVEPAADFTQLVSFDTDFFSHETGMINDYLMGVFSPLDYRTPMIDNVSDGYSGMDRGPVVSAPSVLGSGHREPSAPIQVAIPTEEAQDSMIESRAISRGSPVDQTSRDGGEVGGSLDAIDDVIGSNPWAVSTAAYERLTVEVEKHEQVLPEPFTLPCRQTLSRYVASYIRGFHPHLPFIHIPTSCVETMAPVLLLSLAATGSFYGFEHTHGYAMILLAKSIIAEKLEQRRRESTSRLVRSFPRYAELPNSSSGEHDTSTRSRVTPQPVPTPVFDLELVQALVILQMTMSWLDGPFAEDALAMSSQLAAVTREGLSHPPVEDGHESWKDWSFEEAKRRTLLSAYFVLNIQTICFNVPPQITTSEVNLTLPCSEAEFKAPNPTAWHRLHSKQNVQDMDFQTCLKQLLSGKSLAKEVSAAEFGNYMLVQALLVQIYYERQAASVLLSSSSSLAPSTIKLYDGALAAWSTCWDSAIESALDPSSVHGPLAFNSTAILRLAHVHLGADLFSQCALNSRDPRVVAQAFEPHRNPILLGSAHLDKAVLHAIYALRIPVRVGIAFVARGRTGHWSVQHAISNFACALLLTHWLENIFKLVSESGLDGLRHEERRLLSMIERLIEETHLHDGLGPKDCYPNRIRRLAIAAVKLWAETCQGIQVYELVHIMGETLSLVAESLESRL